MARSPSPAKLLYLVAVSVPLIASACVFGGDSEKDPPSPTPTVPVAPAIGRSGPAPTSTPLGGPTPRPTNVPFTPPTLTPEPARSPVEGLISVVYSFPFVWPAAGPITSFMSPEHPNGIDIGLDTDENMEVRAAAGGGVTSAGGDDDEPLGISIVIDHGNGITTTYGHLSELSVAEGDEVEIGQVIGVGGSTGDSTGNHLHFEVRKDGETVDPLHVLPVDDGDTTAVEIDCATTPFTLPAGSQALINFQGVLDDGESVVGVTAVPLNDGPALEGAVESESEVSLGSPIDFAGPDGLDSYDLEVTIDSSTENQVLSCGFTVQRNEVPTTFYVRAFPPASDVEDGADGEAGEDTAAAATPEPTPTATQVPPTPVPGGSKPGGSTPSGSSPSGSTPGGSTPGGSKPGGSTPR